MAQRIEHARLKLVAPNVLRLSQAPLLRAVEQPIRSTEIIESPPPQQPHLRDIHGKNLPSEFEPTRNSSRGDVISVKIPSRSAGN
jgi:hypothetical protein